MIGVVASKVLSSVLVSRLRVVYENIGLEEQCGFRPERGCADGTDSTGTFNVLRAIIQLRKSNGEEAYGLFIDLIKVFDFISRVRLERGSFCHYSS